MELGLDKIYQEVVSLQVAKRNLLNKISIEEASLKSVQREIDKIQQDHAKIEASIQEAKAFSLKDADELISLKQETYELQKVIDAAKEKLAHQNLEIQAKTQSIEDRKKCIDAKLTEFRAKETHWASFARI